MIFYFPAILFSQKEYSNWYFGYHSGITFNTPNEEPNFLDGNLSTGAENLSIISDSAGNLKFYSTLHCLYNQYKKVFCNRDTVVCPISSSQGSILLNLRNNNYIYIGTNFEVESFTSPTFLSFFIFKDVNNDFKIVKNDTIFSEYNGENLLVIRDFNSNSFYLVANDRYKSIYYLFKYNFSSETFELLQKLPSQFKFDINNKASMAGYLKSSIDGRTIASFQVNKGIELLKFDNLTEKLIYNKTISTKIDEYAESYYSGEFSSDGNYLYFFISDKNNKICRVYIPNYNTSSDIEDLFEIENYSINNFLLGPNFKIYTNSTKSNYLSSIEFPNSNTDISFIENSVKLDDATTGGLLPNIPTTYYNLLRIPDTTFTCLYKEVQFTSILYAPFKDTIYSWTGPNNFVSDLPNPIISNVTKNDEGYYYLTVFNGDSSISYQRKTFLKINESPTPIILKRPDKKLCVGSELILSSNKDYPSYKWSTGDTTPVTRVYKSGTYSLSVIDTLGCEGATSIDVLFYGDSELPITGDTVKCKGEAVTLTSAEEFPEYKWSNGATTRSITVIQPAKYTLTVKTEEGCTISRTIEVKNHPEVKVELKPVPTTICNGDSTLLESKYDVPYYSYLWSTGDTTRGIYVNSKGIYKLKITDIRTGCTDSTEIAIKVEDNLQPTITGSNICSGESATLTALPNDPSYTYKWSNGETSPVITVSQAGTYSVTVSKNGCSGVAEFTVNESPSPEFEILGESIICNNETATLTASKDFAEYHWSTNEISKEIVVNQAGTYTLTVTDDNGCSATKSFTVNKYELKFDISKGSINFGKVYITETKSDKTTITNHSGFEIKLDNGQLVADGQSYPFNYDFVPTQLGVFANSIVIHVIEPCDTVITIPITARVYARTTISTKDIYTQIGRTETVPVYLQCEADLPSQEYTITTDIDRSAFNTSDNYTINQNQPINKTKTKIHQLTGTILLSDKLEYDITFPNYSFTNPYIEVIEEPGKIYIDSVCIFPYRNILLREATTLETNPNPATDELNISITTGIQGAMKLELVSTEGRVIYTDTWQQSTRSKELQINTRAIPSGLYQLRLITPIDAVTKNVVVVE